MRAQFGAPVHDLHRRLISLRRRHPWLHRARATVEHVASDQVVYVSRLGDESLTVALNVASSECALPTPGATRVLEGAAVLTGSGVDATARLAPHGWAVLGP